MWFIFFLSKNTIEKKCCVSTQKVLSFHGRNFAISMSSAMKNRIQHTREQKKNAQISCLPTSTSSRASIYPRSKASFIFWFLVLKCTITLYKKWHSEIQIGESKFLKSKSSYIKKVFDWLLQNVILGLLKEFEDLLLNYLFSGWLRNVIKIILLYVIQ